jgi:exosome complex component RRP42
MADTPGALNLGSLCIIPGKRVWQLHVDALILECAGGNLVDCCVRWVANPELLSHPHHTRVAFPWHSVATVAITHLRAMTLQGLAVRAALGCTEVNKTEIVRDDTGEAVDFEVLEESAPLDVSNFPVLVSLFQIGELHVVDASAEEEACARGHMLVAVNKAGSVCSVHKGGRGGVTPAVLVEMLRLAREKGVALVETLDNKLASLVGGSFTGVT